MISQSDSKYNILITGSNGQLGKVFNCLKSNFNQFNFFLTARNELDVSDFEALSKYVNFNNINVIVNCAAFTNVNEAEFKFDQAMFINSTALKNISSICEH